ncbi:MAG: hypothetical protein CVU50_09300 [Candidatus Cloacimonetes bacterium HGW-Cloacimonetes-3]|nr:MAG: hypothetical protein CVU50_09300 [Candidatus Cloacimonetes bacterium HGW-Cloacimonetes-3]
MKKTSTHTKIINTIAEVFDKLSEEYKKRSEYGFIYIIFSGVVNLLWLINFVEWFKFIFYQLCKFIMKDISRKAAYNWAIDIFVVVKFVFLILFMLMPDNAIILKIVIYLLIMNVFTYFYHHVWRKPSDSCSHWQTRRFANLMLAIVFNILCYTYLLGNGLARYILWENGTPASLYSVLQYSISNTFLLSSSLSVVNAFGLYLQTSQQIVSFIFLVIILSQSIPKPAKED